MDSRAREAAAQGAPKHARARQLHSGESKSVLLCVASVCFELQFIKSGGFLTVTRANFDDSGWRSIDLPQDWAVELPFKEAPLPRTTALTMTGLLSLGSDESRVKDISQGFKPERCRRAKL